MNENENKKSQLPMIIGMIALIAVMFIGIKFVFAALDTAMPDLKHMASQYEESHSASVEAPASSGETDAQAPNFCPHCGDELNDTFQWGQFCPYCGKKVE